MSEPAIRFNNVSKRYGDTLALDNFSLSVNQGEFLGLLGPNGAGKTTAMHLATGLATIDEGDISVFGEDVVDNYREARRRIGIAPQEANFDRFFPLIDCLIYQGGYFGIGRKESRQRANELLEMFELSHKKNSRPTELSGGEKRRLLIAKAVIHDPDIIILDEPTASLDVELRHKLWDYLKDLKQVGKTMILTTHYIEEVEALAEEVAILSNGELVLNDSIENLLEQSGQYQTIVELESIEPQLGDEIEERFPFITQQDSRLLSGRRSFDGEIGALFRFLVERDVDIQGFKFQETELEDVFLETVGDRP